MKFYLTIEKKKVAYRNYPFLKGNDMAVINIPAILKKILDGTDEIDINIRNFVLSQEIENRLFSIYRKKKYKGLLYILSEDIKPDGINSGFITSFRNYIEKRGIFFTDYILIDYSQKVDPKVYKFFTKVI